MSGEEEATVENERERDHSPALSMTDAERAEKAMISSIEDEPAPPRESETERECEEEERERDRAAAEGERDREGEQERERERASLPSFDALAADVLPFSSPSPSPSHSPSASSSAAAALSLSAAPPPPHQVLYPQSLSQSHSQAQALSLSMSMAAPPPPPLPPLQHRLVPPPPFAFPLGAVSQVGFAYPLPHTHTLPHSALSQHPYAHTLHPAFAPHGAFSQHPHAHNSHTTLPHNVLPVKPKKPRPPYFRFCMARRAALKRECPGASFAELGRMLGEEWRAMGERERAQFDAPMPDELLRDRERERERERDALYAAREREREREREMESERVFFAARTVSERESTTERALSLDTTLRERETEREGERDAPQSLASLSAMFRGAYPFVPPSPLNALSQHTQHHPGHHPNGDAFYTLSPALSHSHNVSLSHTNPFSPSLSHSQAPFAVSPAGRETERDRETERARKTKRSLATVSADSPPHSERDREKDELDFIESEKDNNKSTKAQGKADKAKDKDNKVKAKTKRRPSGFILFAKEQRRHVTAQFPAATFSEIGKILGLLWAQQSAEQKQVYAEISRQWTPPP